MDKDIETLVREFRTIIDTWVEHLLSFEDSDLDRDHVSDWGYGSRGSR